METIIVNPVIINKISIISRYLETTNFAKRLGSMDQQKYISTEFAKVANAVFQGTFTVPRLIIGKTFDWHGDDEEYLKSDRFPIFMSYLQSKQITYQENGKTINVGTVVTGILTKVNPAAALILAIDSFNSAPDPQVQAEFVKQMNTAMGLFYDFLEVFKQYNPTFDITTYLPDPSKYVLNEDVKAKNVEYFQTSSFNNLVGLEIQNLTNQKAKDEADRKAKLPQPYTAKEIGIFCLGLVIFGLTVIGIKKASQD